MPLIINRKRPKYPCGSYLDSTGGFTMDAKKFQTRKLAAILLAPSLAFIAIIMLYPLIHSLYLATYNYQLTRPHAIRFDPVRNFTKLIEDTVFFTSLWHTVRFTFFTVAIGSLLGMVFALILDQLSASFAKLRGIILMP